MAKSEQIKTKLLDSLKKMFTKNLAVTIASLFFAVLLWGYVIYYQNPSRTKVMTDIPITFEGEADLLARNLVIRGGQEQLKTATVRVEAPLSKYSSITQDSVSAIVTLSGSVQSAGTFELTVHARTSNGTVLSVSPAKITIEVDKLVNKPVPIEVELEGSIPEGYWASEPITGHDSINISGPQKDLAAISKAVCSISLDGKTGTYIDTLPLTLVDKNGEEVQSKLVGSADLSVTVNMEILAKKTVPVDLAGAIKGKEKLPLYYEVFDLRLTPPTVDIVGSAEVLSGITSLAVETVDVANSKENITQDVILVLPDGVRTLYAGNINAFIGIREQITTIDYKGLQIEIKGLSKKLEAALDVETCDLSVTGRVTLINLLNRGDIKLEADLSNMPEGKYAGIPVKVILPTSQMQSELSLLLTPLTVTATIKAK